jgi:transcriptional regulator with XRE-family HTH domain
MPESVNRLGEALDQLLHERGMSQSELGRRLDITGSAVNLWVKGRARPSREHLEDIEDELDVRPRGSLLELAGYAVDVQAGPTPESLLRKDPGLFPEDRRAFIHLIRMARERFAAQSE